MRILVCIPSWGTKNSSHLNRILSEYDDIAQKYDVDILLFLTDDLDVSRHNNVNIKKIFFPREIKYLLVHQYKRYMSARLNKYDIFIYSEDDILISKKNIDSFMSLSKDLSGTNLVPSFIRYEIKKGDKYKYLIDLHPGNATSRYGTLLSRFIAFKNRYFKGNIIFRVHHLTDSVYIEPNNLHSGCFILDRNQLRVAIESGNFQKGPRGGYCGVLESAASDIYYRCSLQKVYPLDKLESLLVHHLPDKYVTELGEKYKYNKATVPNPKKVRQILDL